MKMLEDHFTELEFYSACSLLKTITPNEPFRDTNNKYHGKKKQYGKSFPGNLMRDGQYDNCTFNNVNFKGTIGNSTIMTKCTFNDCLFKNANFIYSDFTQSTIHANINGGNFDYCDFSLTEIQNSRIKGSSFVSSFFAKNRLADIKLDQCNFKNTFFYKTNFSDIDFTTVSFDQAQFVHSKFQNIILPFFHILQISVGFEEILNQDGIKFKPVDSSYIATCSEYIEDIHMLKPIFYKENNFMALANIYKYEGEINNTYSTIFSGLHYAICHHNFELLHNLCHFAASNQYFSEQCLREFYQYIEEHLLPDKLSHAQYLQYLNELNLAKKILIDCPFNQDVMEIKLNTTICYQNTEKVAETVALINKTLNQIAPDSSNHLIVRHNSPIELTIVLSDSYTTLILAFAALATVFTHGINAVEKIQNLIKNHQEIKNNRLDLKLKELELAQKRTLQKSKETSILIPSDFVNLSYTITNTKEIPKDLLRMKL